MGRPEWEVSSTVAVHRANGCSISCMVVEVDEEEDDARDTKEESDKEECVCIIGLVFVKEGEGMVG